MTSSTEIMVIDSARGAGRILDAYRPRHERAHLLCRWRDEQALAFGNRVLKRLSAIRYRAEVLGLTLVLGADPSFQRLMPELNQGLAASVAPSGFIELVGVGPCRTELIEWFESLRALVAPTVLVALSFPFS